MYDTYVMYNSILLYSNPIIYHNLLLYIVYEIIIVLCYILFIYLIKILVISPYFPLNFPLLSTLFTPLLLHTISPLYVRGHTHIHLIMSSKQDILYI